MGMRYFDTTDAALFYGREAMTRELAARVANEPFLAIVGARGAENRPWRGRDSSLLWAGYTGMTGAVHVITPTAHPLESLAASLTRDSESVTATSTLMDDLKNDSRNRPRIRVTKYCRETLKVSFVNLRHVWRRVLHTKTIDSQENL